jgi:glutamate 5-kinase
MPSTHIRQHGLASASRVIVKFGTQLITSPRGGLDFDYLRDIANQIAQLRRNGMEVTVVSSGAIGAGLAALKMKTRPSDVAELQAVAAVGQRLLMTHLHDAFSPHDLEVGQVLVTRTDFDDRGRFLNIRNCIGHLHRIGCIPIINENDTVAVDELRFGDNDQLAALICNALRADALLLLSVVDGLLDEDGARIDLVENMADAKHQARDEKSALGSGGMISKLDSVALAVGAGEIAVIANGRTPEVLTKLFSNESAGIGTVFTPASRKLDSRQRWIGMTKRPGGDIIVDDGAATAIVKRGKSLLPAGILNVTGQFKRGDVITITGQRNQELARGLTNYSADEIKIIKGKQSNELDALLGSTAYSEVVHRDNMVLAR